MGGLRSEPIALEEDEAGGRSGASHAVDIRFMKKHSPLGGTGRFIIRSSELIDCDVNCGTTGSV